MSRGKKKQPEENYDEDFFDEKRSRFDYESSTRMKLWNIALWIFLMVWVFLCGIDFYQVSQKRKPKFCLTEETRKESGGTIKTCMGLGYKVYTYEKGEEHFIEFGPFWITERKDLF